MLMTYESTAGLTTVGYRIVNDDKTEDTALTTTGVTEISAGGYGVNLADAKAGKTIQWYEGATYSVSERIPTAPDNAGIAAVKTQTDKLTFDASNHVASDLHAIDGALTTGNNANLKLKTLDVQNADGTAITAIGGTNGHGVFAWGDGTGDGLNLQGGATGDGLYSRGGGTSGSGINAVAQATSAGDALRLDSSVGGSGTDLRLMQSRTNLDDMCADAVLDEQVPLHQGVDSLGDYLQYLLTNVFPGASAVADAVLDEALAGHVAAGSLGEQVASAVTKATAIQAKTDTLPAAPAAVGSAMTLTVGERGSIADSVLDEAVAGHSTAGSLGFMLARVYRYFFGKRVNTNTSITVYAADNTTVDATMPVSGNGTTITKDAAS